MYSIIVSAGGSVLSHKAHESDIEQLRQAALIRKVKGKRSLYVAESGLEEMVRTRLRKASGRGPTAAATFGRERFSNAKGSGWSWSHNVPVCAGYGAPIQLAA